MVKKKATGMSKRLGFTDRQTINENKDILRYNERVEREAQGLPPDEPRGPRGSAGRRPARDAEQPSRPPRAPRPVRPPALSEEQIATLTAAYRAVVGESGLDGAAEKVIERLSAHDGFERATMAGWEAAAGAHAEDRSAEQWELLRTAWLSLRVALLEAYVVIKPEAQDLLDREHKQQARLAKPPRPRRRPGRAPLEGRPERKPRPAKVARPVAPAGMPSPSAVARAASAVPPADAPTGADPIVPADAVDVPEPVAEAEPVGEPDTSVAEVVPEPVAAAEPVAEPDISVAEVAEPAPESELDAVLEPEPAAEPEVTVDAVAEEHAGYVTQASDEPTAAETPEDDDQLMLEF